MPRRVKQLADGSAVGNIGIHDPFELIRHLARSQSDPRKAVAELVQNALDEQASHIAIERFRENGETILSILDDGLGVLPDLPRKDALTAIATNIGHSRKKQMTFDERMRQAMLGQYGIGLLGFWAVGHELRILSRINGSEIWALTLFEDSPRYAITRMPEVIDRAPTWTEVQVRRLHRAALAPTVGGRLATYLSVELRGQLVRHGAELRLVDRLARGAADKLVVITPSLLAGERLPGLEPIRLDGFQYPIELTLHFAGDAGPEAGRVRLGCAGAVVLDDLASLPALDHAPWNDDRLVGVIDFPHLEIPPGSRRGIVPNAAADALIEALLAVEPQVTARLEERTQAEAATLSDDMHRQLARLFNKATSFVPHLQWLPVTRKSGSLDEGGLEGTGVATAQTSPRDEGPSPQPELFPPGPLHAVTFRPVKLELAVGEKKNLKAVAQDEEGRTIAAAEVELHWVATPGLRLSTAHELASVEGVSVSNEEAVTVTARQGDRSREGVAMVRVLSEAVRRADAGIPQPEEVSEPLETWRSRMIDERWQINTGHPDYRAFAHEARPRLRYLATLLSKEVVSRNFQQPGVGAILEELVGLLAALERSGAWSRSREP